MSKFILSWIYSEDFHALIANTVWVAVIIRGVLAYYAYISST